MTLRKRFFYGVALLATLIFAAVLMTEKAATQQPATAMGMVTETLYSSAGVGALGSNASVAWFIATPKSGEQYPVVCKLVADSFACRKGSFQ